ncbi:MAG: hypothetical protein WB622_14115 [Acidobacteriaceae bacterium]
MPSRADQLIGLIGETVLGSLSLAWSSRLAGHFAVRIATMRAVAMRSDGPSFGQSGFGV